MTSSNNKLFRGLEQIVSEYSDDSGSLEKILFPLLVIKHSESHSYLGLPRLGEPVDELRSCLGSYQEFFQSNIFSPDLATDTGPVQELIEKIEQLPPFSLEDLAYIYERFVSPHDPKKEGVFYTPIPLVDRIVTDALEELIPRKKKGEISLLDPACGSGIFLIRALKLFSSSTNIKLYGTDKDPLAVEVTRVLLTLALHEGKQLGLPDPSLAGEWQQRIVAGNTLISPENIDPLEEDLQPLCFEEKFPEVVSKGGFDCIVGNPPYGLSRGEQLSTIENEKLKEIYKEYRSGKVNKYLMFMARGYQLLNERGVLSYVVPNAWLGIKDGKAIRELFLKEGLLEQLVIFEKPVFAVPSVEAVTFRVVKGSKRGCVDVYREESPDSKSAAPLFSIQHTSCLERSDATIPTVWSDGIAQVLEKIQNSSYALGASDSPFISQIALQAYSTGKGDPPQSKEDVKAHIYHSTTKLDDDYHPYLNGSDIGRYRHSWSGEFLKYGPWLAEPQSIDRFTGPRIVLREILGESPYLLHCCILTDVSFYNKSVLHIRPTNETGAEMLPALLAVLNSKLASFFIYLCGRKSQRRLFPKIVNGDLGDFPISNQLPQYMSELTELVAASQEDPEDENIREQVDFMVYRAYGLSSAEIGVIEETLSQVA